MDIIVNEACRRLILIRNAVEPQAVKVLGQQNYDFIKDTCTKNPFIMWVALAISFFSLIPLTFFMGFVFITLLITVLCFICIEGSLLAVGGLIFAGIVGFISVIVLLAAVGIKCSAWVMKFLCNIIDNARSNSCPSSGNGEARNNVHDDSVPENSDSKSKDS